MNHRKNLTYLNVQTNCNLSFSLLTIEKLIDYSVTNRISSLALCEWNPYEFLKFYYLCKKAGIKPVWGFKRIINYGSRHLFINFFPRNYQEYRSLNKFFHQQDGGGVLSSSSLEQAACRSLLILEVHNYEEIFLASRLRSEILPYFGEENLADIYLGLNFFPSEIEVLTRSSIQMSLVPFFSIKSFSWDQQHLLSQLGRTSLAGGFTSVSLQSIPHLNRAELVDYFNSHLVGSSTEKDTAQFFSHLFTNLENFLSKISLSIRNSSPVEKEGKFELLRQRCEEKLDLLVSREKKPSYSKTLGKELIIIRNKGYAGYFLELAKIVEIFLENNIEIGPGRGSATSSLVSYLLGLTLIDPVENKLFFWRFLNEKRTDFPDVDIDVENQEAALHLIEKEYGRQSIAKLLVKKRIGWHAAVMASLKLSNAEEKDSLFIEENVSRFLNVQKGENPSLKINYLLEKYQRAFTLAKSIYPLYGGVAPHPSGIIIAAGKLSEKLPVREQEGGFPLCLYQQRYLTKLGFKKFDFLSLTESLSFIKYIKEKNRSRVPGYMELDMAHSKTWSLLKNCLLTGVFQINTKLFSEIISVLQPVNFAELLLVVSLNRPGASTSLRELSQVRAPGQPVKGKQFEATVINEILSLTYGRVIFEEQVSQILSYCLGIDFAEAELVRRNLKVIINNDQDRRNFKLEFISKTTGKLKSFEKDILWKRIIESIPYLFNKAHATSYTYITYYTAYLKANFFTDALSYFLQRNAGNHKVTILLAEEAVLMDYELESPTINTSLWEWRFDTSRKAVLVMGFSQLGRNSSPFFEKAIEERSKNGLFKDWRDLLTRLSHHFAGLEIEDLVIWIELGLFRSFPGSQQWVILHLPSFKRYAQIVSVLGTLPLEHLPFLFLPAESYKELSLFQENQKQYESFGFYPSYLNRWKKFSPGSLHSIKQQLFTLNNNHEQAEAENKKVKIYGVLTSVKKTKNQCLLTLLFFNSSLAAFCDPDFYERNASLLEVHNEAIFTLESGKEKFRNSLFVSAVSACENYKEWKEEGALAILQ